MNQREIERTLLRFEGLVHETARQIVASGVEMEFDDVQQRLRIRIWRAVARYNARHPRAKSLRKYVFMCMADERKDLEKRPRRHLASIDEIRDRVSSGGAHSLADRFDSRYLSVNAEEAFADVPEFELPSTLTATERRLVELRIDGLMLREIDRELDLSRPQREQLMRDVRTKLADWKPSQQAPSPAEPARVPVAA